MESWNFVVRGLDSSGVPKFFGPPTNTKEEAEKLRKSAETIGWRYVAVYDANLTEAKGDKKGEAPSESLSDSASPVSVEE